MKNRSNGKNGKAVVQGKAERSENRQKSQRKSSVFHSISLIVLHVLDAMLLVILLPFMIWQWVSANDRLKIILKAVVEVAVELIMWVIFAGVSILMTTTFVLEEAYFRKNDNEKLRQLMIARNEPTPNDNESQKEYPPHSKEQEKLKTENKDRPLC
ncbi:uncharacterized protein LOC108628430 [Ceratina calcarata]|uniref:Uncharacterized protein LOC108628430 n=1 Tax=Ceratina calcarata TaxID=156304 RepID=A0AAJ7J655_9HYME|nr:uncharacterized protein LOC108628430 [Ceratina calcarata]